MSLAVLSVREVGNTAYRAARRATPANRAQQRGYAHADSEPAASMHASTDATVAGPLHPRTGAATAEDARAVATAAAAESDAIERLGDEIATLSAHIHAATHRLLVLIADFDRLRGWELAGQSSCAHWLALRTGIDLGAAREKVRAAHALTRLPLTSAAMSRGELSFSQVRALTRVAQPDTESALLELACGATTAQLERMVRAWRRGSRVDEAAAERERYEARTVSVFPDDDGMYVIRGRLMPEVGALLLRAIEAASDALFRERDTALPAHVTIERLDASDTQREAAQRRADALGLLAARALAAGLGTPTPSGAHAGAVGGGGDGRDGGDGGNVGARRADTAADIPVSGTRAQRYQVILHVDGATLSAAGEPGRAELEDGTHLSPETCRRLACDASIVKVSHDRAGAVLDVARKTRTISPALRRALDVRDRGCRFPGCGLRFTDAHHVQHWADGGETSLSNCLLLCSYHHTLVHEQGWRVEWWGKGRAAFVDPRGQTHFDGGWQPPSLGPRPVDALLDEHRRRGVGPDAWTAGARWQRELDIPAAIYFGASEVL